MNRLAQIASILFHPVFMPLAGLLIMYSSGIFLADISQQYKMILVLLTVLTTVLMPLIMLPALIFLRHVQSFQLDERRERLIPLFFTTICYFAAHHLIYRFLDGVNLFSLFLLAATFLTLTLLAVSLFWKVSLHTAGAGGITGLVAVLTWNYHTDMTLYAAMAILVTGMLFSARMQLKAHTMVQLLAGFLLGFIMIFMILSFYFQ